MKLLNLIKFYIVGKRFAKRTYDPRVFKTPYFRKKTSIGWRWAYYDKKYRKISGKNIDIPWPVGFGVIVNNPQNFIFDYDDLHIFQSPGSYFQGIGAKTIIGKGTIIAPNVGIISSNHNLQDFSSHDSKGDIVIGERCWIGMNSVILPGVILGDNTIVGAGSVVTKKFESGNVVIAGCPAQIIKKLGDN